MGEIKGQLLGIILVIAVFGAVAGILISTFKGTAETVEEKMEGAVLTDYTPSGAVHPEFSYHY